MQLARCRLLVNAHGYLMVADIKVPCAACNPADAGPQYRRAAAARPCQLQKGHLAQVTHTAPRAQRVQSCSWVLTLLRHLLYLMCCTVAQEVGCVLHKSAVGIGVGLLGMVVAARTQYCRVYEARSVPYTTLTAVSATLLVTLRTGAHHQATSTGLSQAPLVEVLRFNLDEHA